MVKHATTDSLKKGVVPKRILFVVGEPIVTSSNTLFTPFAQVAFE
jgi:hypothetical protein